MVDKKEKLLVCSFCGKNQQEVEKLIKSPKGAYICSSCIGKYMKTLKGEK